MSSLNIAGLVLLKTKQKNQFQEQEAPSIDMLKLSVALKAAQYHHLTNSTVRLKYLGIQSRQLLGLMEQHLQDIDCTGKEKHPLILVKPQFLASQKITPPLKNFYCKSANSFLRIFVKKKSIVKEYQEKQDKIVAYLDVITQLEKNAVQFAGKNLSTNHEKKKKLLQWELKLRSLKEEQQVIRDSIEDQMAQNMKLLKDYSIKQKSLEKMKAHSQRIMYQIENAKRTIQTQYSPIAYRQYSEKLFSIRIKNEVLSKELIKIGVQLKRGVGQNQIFQKHFQSQNHRYFMNGSSRFLHKSKNKKKYLKCKQHISSQTRNKQSLSFSPFSKIEQHCFGQDFEDTHQRSKQNTCYILDRSTDQNISHDYSKVSVF